MGSGGNNNALSPSLSGMYTGVDLWPFEVYTFICIHSSCVFYFLNLIAKEFNCRFQRHKTRYLNSIS